MDIPKELLQETFIRLPYKNVAICKCVCRSWYNLLSDPHFTRLYTSRTPYAAVCAKQVCPNKSKSFFLLEFGPDGELIRTPINPIGKDLVSTENRTRLLSSSRACSTHHVIEKLYLSDMFSVECVEVAESKFDLIRSESEYKIGYVPQINTHKILRLVHNVYDEKVLQAMIFTVGIDCEWRSVDGPFEFNGVSFRGFYHWIPNDIDDSDDWNICTFDFLDEKCSGITKPIELKQLSDVNKLRVLNDRLSLIEFSDCDQNITIWTMEEYGVADSWSKNVVLLSWLPLDTRGEARNHDEFAIWFSQYMSKARCNYRVVTVLPNGSIVLYLVGSCSTFIYVNTEKKQSTKVNVPGVDDRDNISSNYAKFYPLRLI